MQITHFLQKQINCFRRLFLERLEIQKILKARDVHSFIQYKIHLRRKIKFWETFAYVLNEKSIDLTACIGSKCIVYG